MSYPSRAVDATNDTRSIAVSSACGDDQYMSVHRWLCSLRCVMLSVLAYGSIDTFLSASAGIAGTGGAFLEPFGYSLEVILGEMPNGCGLYSGRRGGETGASCCWWCCSFCLRRREPEPLRSPRASPLFERKRRELRLELRDSLREIGAGDVMIVRCGSMRSYWEVMARRVVAAS